MMTTIFLTASPANGQQNGGSYQFIFLFLMIIVFWFFMIRPQSKKAKKQKEFANNLSKGQKVVTVSGIHGKIHAINEDSTIDLEVSAGSFLKIEKSSLSLELSEAVNKVVIVSDKTDKK